jgi:hypothetical protein
LIKITVQFAPPPPQKKRIPNERLLCVSRVMQSGKEAKRTLPCILI